MIIKETRVQCQAKNQTQTFIFHLSDPRQWTQEHVIIWLDWVKREFSLEINNFEAFEKMNGRDIIALGRDEFLNLAPPFTGDILWEHLDILQKGKQTLFESRT